MSLTNYEMLFYAGKVEKEIGEKFRKDWWDPVFREADRRVFCEEAPKKFYAAARVMYVKWFKVWEAKGKPWGDCVDVDFGAWLCKGADPGLLVPAGRPVKHVSSDVFGVTLGPTCPSCRGTAPSSTCASARRTASAAGRPSTSCP